MASEKDYLRVDFDPTDHGKVMAHADQAPHSPRDLFRHLDALGRLLPEVYRVERWQSALRGHHRERFHEGLHEVVLILRGKGTYMIDGDTVEVAADDVVLIKPGEIHSYSDNSDFACISMHFSFSALGEALDSGALEKWRGEPDEFLSFMADTYMSARKIALPDINSLASLATKLMEELARPSVGSGLVAGLCLVEILVLLARSFVFSNKTEPSASPRTRKRDEIMVRRIKRYLDTSYATEIDKDEFLKGFSLHPNYIRTIFKRMTGSSISHYLVERRLLEARRMLGESELSVRRVAEEVGFNDYSYFMRAFKKRYGTTPGSLRRR